MSKSEMVRIVTQLQGKTIELAWLEPDCLNLVMVASKAMVKVIGFQLYIKVQKAEDKSD